MDPGGVRRVTRSQPFDAQVLFRARAATMSSLFLLALLLASWAPRIPQIKEGLELGDGQLGLTLLGAPIGAVLTLWLIGLAVTRYGSITMVRAGLPAYCATGLLVPLVEGPWSLFALLALWGATSSCLDISLNTQAVGIERCYQRPIMTSAHAAWTAGALSGAGIGSAAAALSVPIGVQFAVLGGLGLAAALPATAWMLPDGAAPEVAPGDGRDGWDGDSDRAMPRGPVGTGSRARPFVALCVIAFGSFLCEGVAADWSAVYLTDVAGAAVGIAGIGFVAFTSCMFVVRLFGDRAMARFGPTRTVRGLAVTAMVGFALMLALGSSAFGTVGGIVGFGTLGVGTACVLPAVFSATGRLGSSTGSSIAVVGTVGYVGWLCGPALIGGLAELAGLQFAMVVVFVLLVAITVCASALRGPDSPAAAAEFTADPGTSEISGVPKIPEVG
ncbi:MFS transporter [Frankia sp. B2]|nr:hypothetical protein BMG523Draft_04230 [Frankia sp. BMG5.23]TFE35529.1 MFS transporter [Frankia sp. B2]